MAAIAASLSASFLICWAKYFLAFAFAASVGLNFLSLNMPYTSDIYWPRFCSITSTRSPTAYPSSTRYWLRLSICILMVVRVLARSAGTLARSTSLIGLSTNDSRVLSMNAWSTCTPLGSKPSWIVGSSVLYSATIWERWYLVVPRRMYWSIFSSLKPRILSLSIISDFSAAEFSSRKKRSTKSWSIPLDCFSARAIKLWVWSTYLWMVPSNRSTKSRIAPPPAATKYFWWKALKAARYLLLIGFCFFAIAVLEVWIASMIAGSTVIFSADSALTIVCTIWALPSPLFIPISTSLVTRS